MPADNTPRTQRWDAFIAVCRREGVPEPALRWYVVRIERYIKAHGGRSLRQHDTDCIKQYLESAGRDSTLPAWQFRQLVHALELLYCHVIRAEWATGFDWQYWSDSARELEPDHPTVARHNHPVGAALATNGGTEIATAQLTDIEQLLIAKIRLKNYSIRTEQAYLSWLRRYTRSMRSTIHASSTTPRWRRI